MSSNTRVRRVRRQPVDPRAAAARLLWQLERGRSLSSLLAGEVAGVARRDQGLVKEMCFGVARWRSRLEAVMDRLLQRRLKARDGDVQALVLLGLYQLIHMRVAPHAALAASAGAARNLGKPWAVGLVNAVLRRFQREREGLLEDVDQIPAVRYAYPHWLLEALRNAWPGSWEALAMAGNERPPMSLRVNLARVTPAEYLARLERAGIAARRGGFPPSAVMLERPVDVEGLAGFREGLVSVQDAGAQLATGLLQVQPGQRVLDACAAPGGKTGHLLESAPPGVRVAALDLDPRRLARVQENLHRLGLRAELLLGDARAPRGHWADVQYDRILLDVPCSATGVIRRHPDIKWLRREEDMPGLVRGQQRMLDGIWPLLRPGGMLLYATCSVLPEENQEQVRRFLRRRKDARERPIDGDWGLACEPGRQILPGQDGMDGFYYARLAKKGT